MTSRSTEAGSGWLGYDWVKLIVTILLVLFTFWIGRTPDEPPPAPQALATLVPPTAMVLPPTEEPTSIAASPTTAPTATALPATPTATGSVPAANTVLAITAPSEGAQVAVGTLVVEGTGPSGSAIEILNSDQVVAETTIAADGTWQTEVPVPSDGTLALTIQPVGGEPIETRPIRITVGAGVGEGCPELGLGCTAWVTRAGGFSLRMRSAAGIDQEITARLPVGTQVELLEGPQAVGEFTWWRVRTLGGREGWVSGENLVLQPD
ncbi:MAG: hypothetical protein Fur005_34050 [Roseiflexaceae bacterium]